jgi:threonyl-tRNA synthetase
MAKYDLDTIRHSTAHLMAQAIMELYPKDNVQLGIGPVIENGFYYDIEMDYRLTEEDLIKIENKMKEIIKRDDPIVRHETNKKEAALYFEKIGQKLKVELINDFKDDELVSYYTQGDKFVDLCTGPHVPKTSYLSEHFKLLHTAGAYWRGDEDRKMLQRIYAACFNTANQLKEHLFFIEEAKKRDHRKLGKELDLFIFDPIAPASPFFMPKGATLYNGLVDFMRRIYQSFGYTEVITPQVLDVQLWHTSGHYENYKENMFFTNVEKRDFGLKPMNCPCHMLMFKHHKYSYRDLPMRFADFGRLHRYEKSGVVTGLTRVRTFCQDDAHIFTQPENIQDEILNLLKMFFICYEHFGFNKIKIYLSTRPEKRMGDEKVWDAAEDALKSALNASGFEYQIKEGDGAFYGPKIDIEIADALNRYYQLGTVQLDFQLPERFDLKYTDKDGQDKRPVVIHRALLGSLERFIGVYIEHVGGAFPFWIAPVQATVVPVRNEFHLEYCQKLTKKLKAHGIRVELDDRNESMGLKTREIQRAKVPFMIVAGDKERDANSVSIRKYGEQQSQVVSVEQLISMFHENNLEKIPTKLRESL